MRLNVREKVIINKIMAISKLGPSKKTNSSAAASQPATNQKHTACIVSQCWLKTRARLNLFRHPLNSIAANCGSIGWGPK